jgi:large subunit ribosomal protein L2
MTLIKYYIKSKLKFLKIGKKSQGGRNFHGKVCVSGRGCLNKRNFILINFIKKLNSFGYIIKILMDYNRTSFIGFVIYVNGLSGFIQLCDRSKIGMKFYQGYLLNEQYSNKNLNYYIPLKNIKLFTIISQIELDLNKGSKMIRAGGSSALLIKNEKNKAYIKLPSNWIKIISDKCFAAIGKISNVNNKINNIGSAGNMRRLGFRPKVRGVAKNPCDHPHGGGNGKKSPLRIPVSPWNKITKWTHTLNKKKDKILRRLYKKII